MESDNISRVATALLTVLCFLNHWEIHEIVITFAFNRISHVSMPDFPSDFPTYRAARNFLLAAGKVTLQRRPEAILRLADSLKATVINSLNYDEYAAAFEMAVSLISESWPWLTTYNATDVERLRIVHRYRSHILALRNVRLDFRMHKYLPSLGFCALLHEETW